MGRTGDYEVECWGCLVWGDERGFPWGTDGDTVIRRSVEELAQRGGWAVGQKEERGREGEGHVGLGEEAACE